MRPPRGIETCGLLAGVAKGKDELSVTHLLIPKQKGDENNCEMVGEDEILDYCLSNNLFTLGWIHTHPSQECFMSSSKCCGGRGGWHVGRGWSVKAEGEELADGVLCSRICR